MLVTGDVKEIKLINGTELQVTIREEVLTSKDEYEEVKSTRFEKINPGPHYFLEINPETFPLHEIIKESQKELPKEVGLIFSLLRNHP